MKKFICLIMLIAIVLCCFAGCGSNKGIQIDTHSSDVATTNSQNNTVPVSTEYTNIGTTSKVVTNYSGCWVLLPDGRVIRGTVVSWMIVNEYLIQVTLKDMYLVGTRGDPWDEGEVNTYLVSADRVYFYT